MNGKNYKVPHCGAFFTAHSHPLGPKYSPQDPVFKTLSLHSSYVLQPYSNITVLCCFDVQTLRKKSRRQD